MGNMFRNTDLFHQNVLRAPSVETKISGRGIRYIWSDLFLAFQTPQVLSSQLLNQCVSISVQADIANIGAGFIPILAVRDTNQTVGGFGQNGVTITTGQMLTISIDDAGENYLDPTQYSMIFYTFPLVAIMPFLNVHLAFGVKN